MFGLSRRSIVGTSDRASRGRPPRRARLVALLLAAAGVFAAPAPSSADPVLCATIYYNLLGGPREDLVDDCWVPSPWTPQAGVGHDCGSVVWALKVCYEIDVSFPMP
ncbi:MAG TPA: hypothetical protein VGB83_04235 [Actinomycetota bacterium]